jgi:GTPase SAR1 family protein
METEKEQPSIQVDRAQGIITGDHGHQVNTWITQLILFWVEPLRKQLRKSQQQALLKKIRARIEEDIRSSLYEQILRELKLSAQSEELSHPWHFIYHPSLHDAYELPSKTSIREVYDRTQGVLLILGEGGAGKTTLLLQLALSLIHQTEKGETDFIPVILNLSSWVDKKLPLDKWLVEELNKKPYQIRSNISQRLIKDDLLVPLLDGFNQIVETEQSDCARALNAYCKDHSLAPLVICSRSDKQLKQRKYNFIDATVSIQPLTLQQIDRYVEGVNNSHTRLKEAFRKDHILYELSRTPLMLCILTLAFYYEKAPISWVGETPEDRRKRVFELYIERMLNRKDISHLYSTESTKQWITTLAYYMSNNKISVFYTEYLQIHDFMEVVDTIIIQVCQGAIFSIIAILLFSWICEVITKYLGIYVDNIIINFYRLMAESPALSAMLGYSMFRMVIREFYHNSSSIFILPSKVVWIWQEKSNKYILTVIELIVADVFAILVFLFGLLYAGRFSFTISELIMGLLLICLCLLPKIGRPFPLEEDAFSKINQGIWGNARLAVSLGIGSGCLFGSLTGLAFCLALDPLAGIMVGGSVGLFVSWFVGLYYGGRNFIHHFYLRCLLWISRTLPLNINKFLHYVESLIFLRREKGGYSFIHPLFQNYFMMLNVSGEETPEEVKARYKDHFTNREPLLPSEAGRSKRENQEQIATITWVTDIILNILSNLNLYEQKDMNPHIDRLKINLESIRITIESNLNKIKRALGAESDYYQGLVSICSEILAATKVRFYLDGGKSWSEWLSHLKKVYDTSSELLSTIRSSVSITIEDLNEHEEDTRDQTIRWLNSIDDHRLNKFAYEADSHVHMLLRLYFLFWLSNNEPKANHYKGIADEIEKLSWARSVEDYREIEEAILELQRKLSAS